GVAVAGVGPVGEGEGGGFLVVGVGQAEGGALLGGAVVGARLAEFAEGGGVAAGLGGEVAAEAEHVGPVAEFAVGVEGVEVEACGDEPGRVLGDVEQDEGFLVADAAVHGAGGLGCFGGVLGDVGGDRLLGDVLAVAEGADRAYVELGAPSQGPGRLVPGRGYVDFHTGGSGPDRIGEEVKGGPRRGRVVGAGRAVEADHGMEVHRPALL